jgi:hypothetical protein
MRGPEDRFMAHEVSVRARPPLALVADPLAVAVLIVGRYPALAIGEYEHLGTRIR